MNNKPFFVLYQENKSKFHDNFWKSFNFKSRCHLGVKFRLRTEPSCGDFRHLFCSEAKFPDWSIINVNKWNFLGTIVIFEITKPSDQFIGQSLDQCAPWFSKKIIKKTVKNYNIQKILLWLLRPFLNFYRLLLSFFSNSWYFGFTYWIDSVNIQKNL